MRIALIPVESKCLNSLESGCDKTNCCTGLKCINGPDDTWTRGVCVDDSLMETILEFSKNSEEQGKLSLRLRYLLIKDFFYHR